MKTALKNAAYLSIIVAVGAALAWLLSSGCTEQPQEPPTPPPLPDPVPFKPRAMGEGFIADGGQGVHRLYPRHFKHVGTFRAPDGEEYRYEAAPKAWYRYGDHGSADGTPGSLYWIGHCVRGKVFETAIPALSAIRMTKGTGYDNLYKARLIQEPVEIDETSLQTKGIEILLGRVQGTAQLHGTFGKWFQFSDFPAFFRHGMNLRDGQYWGAWQVGDGRWPTIINTNEYIFTIPKKWQDRWGGYLLGCGRFREGQDASGPSVIAYWPPEYVSNPPAPNTQLPCLPLLLYDKLACWYPPSDKCMVDFCPADRWKGAAVVDLGHKSTLVVVGVKAHGECWYGWRDATGRRVVKGGDAHGDCDEFPQDGIPCFECGANCEALGYGGDSRGYCADRFRSVFLFYDPAQLALVKEGLMACNEPQPYAVLDVTEDMLSHPRHKINLAGIALDDGDAANPDRRLLYVTEKEAGPNGAVAVHVYEVTL